MTVEALRRRRPETLAELLDAYGREIQAVAWLILRDRFLAEDVTIETLLTAFEKAGQIRDDASLRPWLLRAATDGANWRLLLTADPSPIAKARDGGGWTEVVSSGPRFTADDLNEALVGRLTGRNALARVVISCRGGSSVDVAISGGDQTGDLGSFTAPCGDEPITTVGDPFVPDENGGFTAEVRPHGRMWTAVTLQQAPASVAP